MSALRICNEDPAGGCQDPAGAALRLARMFRAWRRRSALSAALARLEDFQLDDLGIRRAEIPALVRASSVAPRLLQRMLARLQLEPALQPRRQLVRTCMVCPAVSRCRVWLDRGGRADGYREFCPNAALLDELRGRSVEWQGGGRTSARAVPG